MEKESVENRFEMRPFTYHNPSRIIFGSGEISQIRELVPNDAPVLFAFGCGSIKRNGVYDQVREALVDHEVVEFPNIAPNADYNTCLELLDAVRQANCGFLLPVGGGSVIDACKFVAAAYYVDGEPWSIISDEMEITKALPLGCILTLPATGSEMNGISVVMRRDIPLKAGFISTHIFPKFSILDPSLTLTVPPEQRANGIIDAFVHVIEQYMTYPIAAPLQDRQAEAILSTLIEIAPGVMRSRPNPDCMASLMWCASTALNGTLMCGVPIDWATHAIGAELTAFYDLDHAVTLAILLPGVWEYGFDSKKEKLAQMAWRVWGVDKELSVEQAARETIRLTESFFQELGVRTRLSDYDITREMCEPVWQRLIEREKAYGEHRNVDGAATEQILNSRL